MKRILLLLAVATLALASCQKKCRCYHYNGAIHEFSAEELEAMGQTCTSLSSESYNYGLTYSLCEWSIL